MFSHLALVSQYVGYNFTSIIVFLLFIPADMFLGYENRSLTTAAVDQ